MTASTTAATDFDAHLQDDVFHSTEAVAGAGDGPPQVREEARNGWIAVAVVLGGIVAGSSAFAVGALRPEAVTQRNVSVGGAALTVPTAMLRTPEIVGDGPQARIDLTLSWPDLGPLEPHLAAARASWSASGQSSPDLAQVTLLPADDSPAPETRVASLYARFLEPHVMQGPGDLVTRHFRRNSPYAGEVLVFSPPDGRRVVARCESEPTHATPTDPGTPPALCLAEFRRRGLDVQLRFEPRLAAGLEVARQRLAALIDRLAR
ncbi:MAG: hypothetical protein U1E62_09350 [Alsobacter sp.]